MGWGVWSGWGRRRDVEIKCDELGMALDAEGCPSARTTATFRPRTNDIWADRK